MLEWRAREQLCYIKYRGCETMDWIQLARDKDQLQDVDVQ